MPPAGPLAALTCENIAEQAGISLADLETLAARADAHYNPPHFVPKLDEKGQTRLRDGRPQARRIDAPRADLKHAQRATVEALRMLLPPLGCVYDAPGRGAIRGAHRHQGRRFHFVTDLQSFFPSVGRARLRKGLARLGASSHAAGFVAALGTLHGRLPQGAPTSGDLASIAFRDADLDLLAFARAHGLVYTRYADDLTFSGSDDFQRASLEVPGIISRHDFQVVHYKTAYKVGRLQTLGVVIGQNTLRAPSEIVERASDPNTQPAVQAGLLAYRDQVRRT